MSWQVAFFAAAASVLLSRGAAASPTDLYGGLPRGTATAGTQTASADDAGAAIYNPAGIAFAGASGKTSFQLGFAYGQPFLSVDREKAESGAQSAYPTRNPTGQGWYTASGVLPLGGKIKNRAALAFAFYFPKDKFIRVESLEPRDPQWLRYQSDADRLALATGLGIRINDWVSVGIGAHLLATLDGTVNFDIDIATKTVKRRDISFKLKPGVAPSAGVIVTPHRDWRLAFAYRGPLQLTVSQPNLIGLGGIGFDLGVKASVLYSPHQFAFGAQYHPTTQWTLAFDLKYDLWSQAPNPAVQLSVKVTGDVSSGLGLDALNFATRDGPTGFTNTLTPSLSAEYEMVSQTKLRFGYAFRPPYVPNQTETTNYLDTSTHILGAGLTTPFRDPLELFSQPLHFDLAAQMQIAQDRSVVKGNTSDPVGNYRFGGIAVAANAALRYEF